MPPEVPDLLDMPGDELDELFRRSPAGEIPDGEADGTVLLAPGTNLSDPAAKVLHLVAWKGKVFDREKGELLNEVGPLGLKLIRAKVHKEESWLAARKRSSSTTRRRRSSPSGSATRFVRSRPGSTSDSCSGNARRSSTSR